MATHEERLIAARKKAAIKAASKLFEAAEALSSFTNSCLEFTDGSAPSRGDDSRILLNRSITEYACWLDSKYGK